MERKYNTFSIGELFAESAMEEELTDIVSTFKSPQNHDIEAFLHDSAMQSYKQGQSVTYLVYSDDEIPILVGYFTLLVKPIKIQPFSKSLERRCRRLSKPDTNNFFTVSAFLIAQFGKNYNLPKEKRIEGNTLLSIAESKILEIKKQIGGVFIFLECEDSKDDFLLNFYTSNTNMYRVFGERMTEKGKKLYQLIKSI
jgi:hypothetical protein